MADYAVRAAQVDKIFAAMDLNKAGEVEYNEFLGAALTSQKTLTNPSLLAAFHIMDTNHDGCARPGHAPCTAPPPATRHAPRRRDARGRAYLHCTRRRLCAG